MDVVSVAVLRFDETSGRLRELAFTDPEGNETTFSIEGYEPGLEPGRFNPPEDLEWIGF